MGANDPSRPRSSGRSRGLLNALLLTLICASPGCISGWVYTDITVPIVTNMENTPRNSRKVELSSHDVKFRGITWAEINSRAIADAAKQYGLTTIHFADQRTVSFFGGVYRRRSVLVWGE